MRIEIAISPAATVKVVENAAKSVLPPMDFKVTALYGDTTVDVATLNAYVERMIAKFTYEDCCVQRKKAVGALN